MNTKTIILWGREDLLGKGVESFLCNQDGWNVVRISIKESIDVLIRKIITLKPEVVVLYEGDNAVDAQLPWILIQLRPTLKVITMSLENNSMEVYKKQKVNIKELTNLLSVVND